MMTYRMSRIARFVAVTFAVCTALAIAAPGAATPAAPQPVVRGDWLWPIAPPHPVESPFVAPPGPYAAGHRGIDIATAPGVEIIAPEDGTVYFAGTVVDRGVLTLEHSGGLLSSFEPVTALVASGARVQAGQLVATVSSGGHCSERCLHFGVRLDGQYVSPLLYLGGIPRAVLLPISATPAGGRNGSFP